MLLVELLYLQVIPRNNCTQHAEGLMCNNRHSEGGLYFVPPQQQSCKVSVQFIRSACVCLGNGLKAAEIEPERGCAATARKGMMQNGWANICEQNITVVMRVAKRPRQT